MTRTQHPKRPVEAVLREEKLRYLCRQDPPVVGSAAPLREGVLRLRSDQSHGAVLVIEGGNAGPELVGIFTERDYLDKVAGSGISMNTPIAELMTPNPRTVSPDETVAAAIRLMTEGGYRHIPICHPDGSIAGLISAQDIITYLAEFFPKEVYNLPPRIHQSQRFSAREGG
jgi:CBS domain-containing protein